MSNNTLDLVRLLGTALDSVTNPDPNTLTTKNPYPTPFITPLTVSTAWTTQGRKALFPIGIQDGRGEIPIKVHFVPSGGSSTTYTVTMWMYNTISNSWATPVNSATFSYTGEVIDYIENPGNDPIFLQINSLSSGTLSIYFNGALAQAL